MLQKENWITEIMMCVHQPIRIKFIQPEIFERTDVWFGNVFGDFGRNGIRSGNFKSGSFQNRIEICTGNVYVKCRFRRNHNFFSKLQRYNDLSILALFSKWWISSLRLGQGLQVIILTLSWPRSHRCSSPRGVSVYHAATREWSDVTATAFGGMTWFFRLLWIGS